VLTQFCGSQMPNHAVTVLTTSLHYKGGFFDESILLVQLGAIGFYPK